jgi:hypothetical protein
MAILALRARLAGEVVRSRPDALLTLLWMVEGFAGHARTPRYFLLMLS